MRSDGTAIRRIFNRKGTWVGRPSWSPDSKSIAFGLLDASDDYGYDIGGSIVVIRRTGGGLRYLTVGGLIDGSGDPGSNPDDWEPDWSPDGTRLAFTRVVWFCGSCDADEVFSMAADGSDVRWVTMDTHYAVDRPSWSPSGDRIAAEGHGVSIFTATGELLRVLDPLGTEPAWQPLK